MLAWYQNRDAKHGSDGYWVGVDDTPSPDGGKAAGIFAFVITGLLGLVMLGVGFPLYADIAVVVVGVAAAFVIGRRVYRLVRRRPHLNEQWSEDDEL